MKHFYPHLWRKKKSHRAPWMGTCQLALICYPCCLNGHVFTCSSPIFPLIDRMSTYCYACLLCMCVEWGQSMVVFQGHLSITWKKEMRWLVKHKEWKKKVARKLLNGIFCAVVVLYMSSAVINSTCYASPSNLRRGGIPRRRLLCAWREALAWMLLRMWRSGTPSGLLLVQLQRWELQIELWNHKNMQEKVNKARMKHTRGVTTRGKWVGNEQQCWAHRALFSPFT